MEVLSKLSLVLKAEHIGEFLESCDRLFHSRKADVKNELYTSIILISVTLER